LNILEITLAKQNFMYENFKSREITFRECLLSFGPEILVFPCALSTRIKICVTVNFLLVLYGCETWSLTYRENQKLRMIGNKTLRKVVQRWI
jgi:hypothetical protein